MKSLYKFFILSLALGFSCVTLAAIENWSASYVVQSAGNAVKVSHEPNQVSLFDMTGTHGYVVYSGVYFDKNQNWYGVIPQNDCEFAVKESMVNFEDQLRKLGTIISKELIFDNSSNP